MATLKLDLAACAAQAWANGGGVTRELQRWPPRGAWQWRLSLATIAAPGPFSPLGADVQRQLLWLQGGGLSLRLAGVARRVDATQPLLAFPAEPAPVCTQLDAPALVLNLMTRGARAGALLPLPQVPPSRDRGGHLLLLLLDEDSSPETPRGRLTLAPTRPPIPARGAWVALPA